MQKLVSHIMNMDGILKNKRIGIFVLCLCGLFSFQVWATLDEIQLPVPKIMNEMSVSELKNEPIPLSLQTISDLLSSADRVNRDFPSSVLQIYLIIPAGAYFYHATTNSLILVNPENLTPYTHSPFTILYVGNIQDQSDAFVVRSGDVGQDFSTTAALKGLFSFYSTDTDRMYLKKKLKLEETSNILLAQSIGELDED